MPSLFVSHGAPDLVVSGHPAARFLAELGEALSRPRAILVISAHWERPEPAITTAAAPATIHDFSGWPRELYALRYPAPGAPWLAERVRGLLAAHTVPLAEDPVRGLDHGAWVPLSLAWPSADVPVAQLSLLRNGDAARHFALGRALAPLREEGVLVLGSGSAVHNLGALAPEGTPPPTWAEVFDAWLADAIAARSLAELTAFPASPREARLAHPTPEHLLPLLVAMGAGWDGGRSAPLHRSWSYGSLSMAAYAFGGDEVGRLTRRAGGAVPVHA
jgi:4,5-DOPA dioxygenase extradiol